MTNTKKIILAIILVLAAVAIFITTKHKPEPAPAPVVEATSTVISDQNEFYSIKAEVPKEPRDKDGIMEKMVTSIVDAKKEDWKIGGGLYTEEKNLSVQYPDRPFIKYELDIQFDRFESKAKDTVSYVFKNYEFTGGAHGNTALTTYTFDANGLVSIDNLLNLTQENKVALTKLMEKKLRPSLGQMLNDSMLMDGLGLSYLKADGTIDKTKSDGFDLRTNFDNFVITDEGIKFIFGQYQVAAYAVGMPEVVLTWEELGPYLK